MQRYFIQLSYNGTAYHGWQTQTNTLITVQQVVNEMLSKLLNESITVMGCGRTDAGVHAEHFFAHFDSSNDHLKEDEDKWIFKFNHSLPQDIAIQKIIPVHEKANARFDATARTYRYIIKRKKDPFQFEKSCLYYGELNVAAMNQAALLLFNYSDFTSFAKSNTSNSTNICKLFKAEWKEENDCLIFIVSADRFLRNMVRAIVGTLMDVGKGKMTLDEFKNVIESKNRSEAGFSVPASGLSLIKVDYPEELIHA